MHYFVKLSSNHCDFLVYHRISIYIKVFNRFIRSFNLPVGMQKVQVGRSNNTYDIGATITWIVSMMVSVYNIKKEGTCQFSLSICRI